MDVVVLRFDAPLMSFGGVIIDQHGPTERFPGRSLLTGLFGNAFGYSHGDSDLLNALESRIEYAARWDIPPVPIIDYHTVDLGQAKMREKGWTNRGTAEHRDGGTAAFGTHERYRHYLANGVLTLTCLLHGGESPSTVDLHEALKTPERPLFFGRKTCLPAAPVLHDLFDAPDVLTALRAVSPAKRIGTEASKKMQACWPVHLGVPSGAERVLVRDLRNWKNRIHTGSRFQTYGIIEVP